MVDHRDVGGIAGLGRMHQRAALVAESYGKPMQTFRHALEVRRHDPRLLQPYQHAGVVHETVAIRGIHTVTGVDEVECQVVADEWRFQRCGLTFNHGCNVTFNFGIDKLRVAIVT